jgi:hypothetical protein
MLMGHERVEGLGEMVVGAPHFSLPSSLSQSQIWPFSRFDSHVNSVADWSFVCLIVFGLVSARNLELSCASMTG